MASGGGYNVTHDQEIAVLNTISSDGEQVREGHLASPDCVRPFRLRGER